METNSKNHCNEGLVKEIYEDYLIVEIMLQSACAGCHANAVCLSSQRKGEKMKAFIADRSEHFQVNEKVTVYMEESLGRKAVVIGYLFPFIILSLALFTTYYLTKNDLIAFVIAIGFVAVYYLLVWRFNKSGRMDKRFILYARKEG